MTRSVRRTRRMLQVTGASAAALLALRACSSVGVRGLLRVEIGLAEAVR